MTSLSAAAIRWRRSESVGLRENRVDKDDADERIDIVGIEFERPCEALARLGQGFGIDALVDLVKSAQPIVQRIRVGGPLRPPRFDGNDLGFQFVGDARDDLVLHDEKVGDRLVEALRPQVRARLRFDQLHVDAHSLAAALDAAFEHVAHPKLAPDLPRVGRLALVGECGVARDDEGARHAGEIGGQALGHAIDEISLLRAVADARERQHDDGEARRSGRPNRDGGILPHGAASHAVNPHGPRDVLQRLLAEIGKFRLDAAADMLIGRPGNANAARLSDPFEP